MADTAAAQPPIPPSLGRGWWARLFAASSVAFACLTVTIEIGDVVTDALITAEYLETGRNGLFPAMVGCMSAAHAVFVFAGAEIVGEFPSWRGWNEVPRVLRWLLALVFCPLVPTVNLILEFRDPSGSKPSLGFFRRRGAAAVAVPDPRSDPADDDTGDDQLSRAAREELERSAWPRSMVRFVESALDENVHRYGLFYVQTATEALPSAVIQLIAVLITSSPPSAVQQLSLIFSLLSIASKLFLIARAYNLGVVACKAALVTHDIFCFCFLLVTIIAPETTRDVSFYGFKLSWIGYVWLWKMVVCGAGALLHGIVLVVYGFAEPQNNCVEKASYGMAFLTGLMLCGPLAVCAEFMKLSYGALLLRTDEPPRSLWPVLATLEAFLSRDDADSTKLRHVVVSLVDLQLPDADTTAPLPAGMSAMQRARRVDQLREQQRRREELSVRFPEIRSRALDMEVVFDVWALRDVINPNWCRDHQLAVFRESRCDQQVITVWSSILFVAGSAAQLISFAYPFVTTGQTGFANLNGLQAACFLCLVGSLAVVLVTLPSAFRYFRINVCIAPLVSAATPNMAALLRIIEDYHAPPHVGALQETISIDVLPVQVARVVGLYLTSSDMGLEGLTVAECKEINRRLRSRPFEPFDVPDDDNGSGGWDDRSPTSSSFFRTRRAATEPYGGVGGGGAAAVGVAMSRQASSATV